jgi:hypothetical protein
MPANYTSIYDFGLNICMKTLREMMDLVEAAQQPVAEAAETNTFSDFHEWKESVYAMNADITQMGRAGQYTAIGANGVIGKFDSNTNQGYINGQQDVAEDQIDEASPEAMSKIDKLFRDR